MFIQTILIFSVLLDVLVTLGHRLETPTAMKLGNLDLQVIVECSKFSMEVDLHEWSKRSTLFL